jgi:hypothetical protein
VYVDLCRWQISPQAKNARLAYFMGAFGFLLEFREAVTALLSAHAIVS